MTQTQAHTSPVKSNMYNMVENLRKEAKNNPVFHTICKLFAARERARQQVTLSNLRLTTAKEGFNFTKQQHEQVLKFLASVGVGKLDIDTKGELRALKDIRFTLQSIGAAAIAKSEGLDKFKMQAQFNSLPTKDTQEKKYSTARAPLKADVSGRYAAALVVRIDGQSVQFELPKGVTTKELGEILSTLYAKSEIKL